MDLPLQTCILCHILYVSWSLCVWTPASSCQGEAWFLSAQWPPLCSQNPSPRGPRKLPTLCCQDSEITTRQVFLSQMENELRTCVDKLDRGGRERAEKWVIQHMAKVSSTGARLFNGDFVLTSVAAMSRCCCCHMLAFGTANSKTHFINAIKHTNI